MQALRVCLDDDHGNVDNSVSDLTTSSKPMNIASVRASSLRTCGLRAAARAASNLAMSLSPQAGLSLPNTSSSKLSYANSQEPGEESQLNAFAMVDKLVDITASLLWQMPEPSKVADQQGVTASKNVKGLQSLARSVDTKDRQAKLGVYDWIDSQSEDAVKDSSTIGFGTNGKSKDSQAALSDMALVKEVSSEFPLTRGPYLKQQGNSESYTVQGRPGTASLPTDRHTDFQCPLLNSKQNSEEGNVVKIELHDLDENHLEEDTEVLDIGTNTQIALEAIDIMRHGALSRSFNEKTEVCPMFEIGNDTQTALDAMDILRCGHEPNPDPLCGSTRLDDEDWRCQRQGEVSALNHKLEKNTLSFPNTPGKKVVLSRSSAGSKPSGIKGSAKRTSNISKKVGKAASLKWTARDDNKSFLLDFSSAIVPRRKRSRLSSPRVPINENIEAFGWHKLGLPCYGAHPGAGKPDKSQEAKSPVRPEKNAELMVLTEATNGHLHRQKKKELPVKRNCHSSLEQGRKKRKCESKSIFVLFSHSLSETMIRQQKKVLKKLGGHVATSAGKATHFVADCFVRSQNMLEIMAAGKMVVTTNWLEGCCQAEYFVDEESYILMDARKEKEWGFCMHSSLTASRRKPLLKGMQVVVTPNTVPDITAVKAIIECAGGQVLQKLSISPSLKQIETASISFVLAGEDDFDYCAEYVRNGCRVYSTELILHGIVVQNLDFSRNRLFLDKLQ